MVRPLKTGKVGLHGAAWAGEADVVKVEVSTDGGTSWHSANFGHEQAHYAWRLWNYEWKAKPGTTLSSPRDRQPGTHSAGYFGVNPSGYLYNAVDQVKIHVA